MSVLSKGGCEVMESLRALMAAVKSWRRDKVGGSRLDPGNELMNVVGRGRRKRGLERMHYNMALSIARREQDVGAVQRLLGYMGDDRIKGDVETYSYAMHTFAGIGDVRTVISLWKEMRSHHLRASIDCYNALFRAIHREAKNLELDLSAAPRTRLLKALSEMLKSQFHPTQLHYGYLLRHAKNEVLALDLYHFCLGKGMEVGGIVTGLAVFYENSVRFGRSDPLEAYGSILKHTTEIDRGRDAHAVILRMLLNAKLHEECEKYFISAYETESPPRDAVQQFPLILAIHNAEARVAAAASHKIKSEILKTATKRLDCYRHTANTSPMTTLWEAVISLYIAANEIEGGKAIVSLMLAEDVDVSRKINDMVVSGLGLNPLRGDAVLHHKGQTSHRQAADVLRK